MSPRPLIFISAVSQELRSARQLVANTLTFLGYEPVWQDIFGTESGDLRERLRDQIDKCKGVVQLVGHCYGAEPQLPDKQFGRVSYTQFEALYARYKGKKVWYLFISEDFPVDPCEREPEEVRKLQAFYRRGLQTDTHVFHALASREALETSVLKLRDDLTGLRRGVRRWAAAVATLLAVSVAIGLWLLRGQQQTAQQVGETKQALAAMTAEISKLREGIAEYPNVEANVRQAQAGESLAVVEEKVYAELAKQLKVDANLLREKMPQFAEQLKRASDASSYERANASYFAKDFREAERFALLAAAAAKRSGPSEAAKVVQAYELAGLSAQRRAQYDGALEHFRAAEALTDRERDLKEWSRVQYAIARLMLEQGQYSEAESVWRSVIEARTQALGPDHADTLRSRMGLAAAMENQGRYAEAEAATREIISAQEKLLGPEHADTLATRHNLAKVLRNEGEYAKAESEYREVIKVEEKVFGPEHPDTLRSRGGLAVAMEYQGKYPEAEAENREVIRLMQKVLGAEHPDVFATRNNLAEVLRKQGRFPEAEAEYRDVIQLEVKVLGAMHSDTLKSRNNLAIALNSQGKNREAEAEFREVITMKEKLLGANHPDTLSTRNNLVNAFLLQRDFPRAEAEFRAVVELEEKVIGPEHPNTLKTRENLAITLGRQRKHAEAEAEFRKVVAAGEKVFGADHPDTLRSRLSLAVALSQNGKTAEARQVVARVVEVAEKVWGARHPMTRAAGKLRDDLKGKP